jgi:hypothetical protein
MARLPDYQHVIQQTDGIVALTEDGTEAELARFDPGNGAEVTTALMEIRDSGLNDESKCFAWFWAGYFHAHANRMPEAPRKAYATETIEGEMVTVTELDGTVIVRFDPRDDNAAAQAQKNIYDSTLPGDDKIWAHFWCGFFYGQAS